MQRSFLNAGSRSCLNANGSIPSRCTSDLTSRTLTRSFGNGKRKTKTSSLNDRNRDKAVKAAGDRALAAKYDRNLYNREYRERRKEAAEARKDKEDDTRTYEVAGIYRKAMQQPGKDALKNMKEDWALGPLAPKRDVGERAGKMGTVDMGLHQLYNLTKTQREDVKARMGDNVFKPHDRVVVLSGRDRGKIGNILEIEEERMSATIEGIGKIAVHVPDYMRSHESDERSFRVMRRDVRLDQLRIVVPVRDPATNKLKDVILDRMIIKEVLVKREGKVAKIKPGQKLITDEGKYLERESEKEYELEGYKWKTLRYIPGTETEIVDHSEKDDEHDDQVDYNACDTLTEEMDQQTYFPWLNEPPFAASIFKEITLRDRKEVTKFDEKIEASIRERAEAKARKQLELEDRVRTPLQELKVELKKEQSKARKERRSEFEGKAPQKTAEQKEDIMVTIGRAMAKNYAEKPHLLAESRAELVMNVWAQEDMTEGATEARA